MTHKLVPIEPTDEMLWRTEEPFSPWRKCPECGTQMGSSKNEQRKFYKAMLEAAPDVGGEPLRVVFGKGLYGVHEGTIEGLPCLTISNKGTGVIGEPTTHEHMTEMELEREVVSLVFENKESYDVVKSRFDKVYSSKDDVGGEAVAWLRKNGFRFNADIEPSDDSELALFTYPPNAAKRIAELEADNARLVEALKSSNVFLDPFDDKVQLAINSNLIAEMECKV